jgi:hypothetical protein
MSRYLHNLEIRIEQNGYVAIWKMDEWIDARRGRGVKNLECSIIFREHHCEVDAANQ